MMVEKKELTKTEENEDVTSNDYFNGPKDTNSSSKQFESRPGIQCHLISKAEKTKV